MGLVLVFVLWCEITLIYFCKCQCALLSFMETATVTLTTQLWTKVLKPQFMADGAFTGKWSTLFCSIVDRTALTLAITIQNDDRSCYFCLSQFGLLCICPPLSGNIEPSFLCNILVCGQPLNHPQIHTQTMNIPFNIPVTYCVSQWCSLCLDLSWKHLSN